MRISNEPKQWTGKAPTHCDLCKVQIADAFSGLATEFSGRWAICCDDCVTLHSRYPDKPYGVGRGQRYKRVMTAKRVVVMLTGEEMTLSDSARVRWVKSAG